MNRVPIRALVVAAIPALLPAAAGAQDAAAGQRVFTTQCRACHAVPAAEARNQVGPNLWGSFGRRAAAVQGFRYSQPMQQKASEGLTWTEENLRAYLANPRAVVPGGTMAYPGLRNEQQLNDLIAYLKSAGPAQ